MAIEVIDNGSASGVVNRSESAVGTSSSTADITFANADGYTVNSTTDVNTNASGLVNNSNLNIGIRSGSPVGAQVFDLSGHGNNITARGNTVSATISNDDDSAANKVTLTSTGQSTIASTGMNNINAENTGSTVTQLSGVSGKDFSFSGSTSGTDAVTVSSGSGIVKTNGGIDTVVDHSDGKVTVDLGTNASKTAETYTADHGNKVINIGAGQHNGVYNLNGTEGSNNVYIDKNATGTDVINGFNPTSGKIYVSNHSTMTEDKSAHTVTITNGKHTTVLTDTSIDELKQNNAIDSNGIGASQTHHSDMSLSTKLMIGLATAPVLSFFLSGMAFLGMRSSYKTQANEDAQRIYARQVNNSKVVDGAVMAECGEQLHDSQARKNFIDGSKKTLASGGAIGGAAMAGVAIAATVATGGLFPLIMAAAALGGGVVMGAAGYFGGENVAKKSSESIIKSAIMNPDNHDPKIGLAATEEKYANSRAGSKKWAESVVAGKGSSGVGVA